MTSHSPIVAAGDALDDGPRLSVILPCWNAEVFIERSIRSVLDQREVPLELLVIDDGSTDGTAAIVSDIAARDDRVRLHRLAENLGVSNARNVALDAARAPWVAFVDADDVMLPGAVAALMGPTDDPAVATVVGQRVWSDGQRRWLAAGYQLPDIQEPGRKGLATHDGLLYYLATTGKVFRRSVVSDVRFEGRVLGDLAWTLRAFLRAGDGIEVIGDTVYQWNRPSQDNPFSTITADSRGSLPKAVASAQGAVGSLRLSLLDLDRFVEDPATRDRLRQGIFDRLIRVDLAPSLNAAIRRRDRDIGALFMMHAAYAAVGRVEAGRSAILVDHIVRPAVETWPWLSRTARAELWRMVGSVVRRRPAMARAVGLRGGSGVATFLDGNLPSPVGPAAADAVMVARSAARGVRHRLSRRRG